MYSRYFSGPNKHKWSKRLTFIALDELDNEVLTYALTTAYCEVASRNLAEQIRQTDE
jgi:hypothetical protein